MDNTAHKFPAQQLPFNKKGKKWRKQCVDYACDHTFLASSSNRKSFEHKRINYDLIDGMLNMHDIEEILNPTHLRDNLIPETIQHYPLMNPKLHLLQGEEAKRVFDFKAIVTDSNSISEVSKRKCEELLQDLQRLVQEGAQTEDELNLGLENLNKYYSYTWQDFKEQRANILLNHYIKKLDVPLLFNDGFMDAMTVGEEIYLLDIVGGEPTIEKLNPLNITILKSSNSNHVEDADMIILEDYWSPGRIIDTYGEELSDKDRAYLEDLNSDTLGSSDVDAAGNINETNGFVRRPNDIPFATDDVIHDLFGQNVGFASNSEYDANGNVRVVRIFWKSRRKIKKVTSYNPETGDEEINFRDETYVLDKNMGEKEETFWVNEAWEGTKIGKEIYVRIRPRPIQFNQLSDPSRCHFGIIGYIYSTNGRAPFSLVDMMKSYNYLYDVVHYRLVKLIAKNYGKIQKLDMAFIPEEWKIDKWLYYIRKDNIAVTNSFNEGKKGAATGKLAASLNNNSSGVIDLDEGNQIQQFINILEFLKMAMSELVGITKQREGQVSNRETVGGVERATLQSSHITEWLFTRHDTLKKNVLTAFLEVLKAGMRGRNQVMQFFLPDYATRMAMIDGDDFAESDYGVLIDSSQQTQELNQKMDTLVQAAIQNQMINFSTALKLYSSCSMAEKTRMIENNEREVQQMSQQARQQELEAKQQELQIKAQQEQSKLELENAMNERDNDTRLTIAMIQAEANQEEEKEPDTSSMDALVEKMREFDAKMKLDRDRLAFDKDKAEKDRQVKREQIHAHKTTTSK